MEKFIYNIKFDNILIRTVIGKDQTGPYTVLSYNAVYRGKANIAFLPLSPSKMEVWLEDWQNKNQKLLENVLNGRKKRWDEIFEANGEQR